MEQEDTYKVTIFIEGHEPLIFENVFSIVNHDNYVEFKYYDEEEDIHYIATNSIYVAKI